MVQRGQRRRGRGRDRGERPEQRVAVSGRVAADELRVPEVVPGVQPDVVLPTVRAHPETEYTMGLLGCMVKKGPSVAVVDRLR